MEKEDPPKTPKRQKPSKSHSKSRQKHQPSGSKKRKNSELHEETTIQKTLPQPTPHQSECFICAQPYNLNRKLPVITCQNNHTFCLNCISLSLKANKPNCPMCRSVMEPNQLNSMLYHEVLDCYKEKNKHLEREVIEKRLVKVGIKKFSKKHSCMDDFQLVPRVGKVIKRKNNGEPSLLVLEPEMLEKSIQSYRFIYYPSKQVEVSFGVCIYDKFLLEMVQNCGFDTKILDFFIKKKDSFIKVDSKKGLRVLVNVDLEKNEIHWFSQRQNPKNKNEQDYYLISTEPIEISKKVGDLAFYPYCVLYNVGDMIELNK